VFMEAVNTEWAGATATHLTLIREVFSSNLGRGMPNLTNMLRSFRQ
jgi:hypothetical protein